MCLKTSENQKTIVSAYGNKKEESVHTSFVKKKHAKKSPCKKPACLLWFSITLFKPTGLGALSVNKLY